MQGKDKQTPASQAPKLVADRILNDTYARFGKVIIERDFQMPDGQVLPILCVANSGMDPFIIFALTEQKTVFLVNQFRFGTNEWLLELPGGNPKAGQTWEEGVQAELLEEVGAEAHEVKIIGTPMPFDPALGNARFTAVLATGCRIVRPQHLGSAEIMTIKELPVTKFREMLKNGKITDAKTVAAGYLALDHLGLLE